MAEGRRGRLKNRIRNEGVTHLEPHEALEAMLYPFIPRIDTAGIARSLLKKYGSLYGVVHADSDELFQEKHMTRLAAKMLPFQYRAFEYLTNNYTDERLPLSIPDETRRYVLRLPEQHGKEGVFLVLMDGQYKPIYSESISGKDPDSETPSIRKILSMIVDADAQFIFLVHTHPQTKPLLPSPSDFRLICNMRASLKGIKVNISDYFVVCNNVGLSFRHQGLLDKYFRLANFIRYDWLERCGDRGYFKEDARGISYLSYHDYDLYLKRYFGF